MPDREQPGGKAGGKTGGKAIHSRLAPRERRLCSSTEAMRLLLERLGGPEASRRNALWKDWSAIVGEDVAALGCPLGQKDGVLLIGAEDSMALQELSLLSGEILERANAFMHGEPFTEVRVQLMQGQRDLAAPRPEPPPAQAPAEPPLPRLGGLLGRLDPDSPVTRCYKAFVALSQKQDEDK